MERGEADIEDSVPLGRHNRRRSKALDREVQGIKDEDTYEGLAECR
jgi:hypothetical protein